MEDRGGNRIEPVPAVGDVLAAKRRRFLKAAQTAGLFAALTAFGGYLWAASGDAVPFRYVSLWHSVKCVFYFRGRVNPMGVFVLVQLAFIAYCVWMRHKLRPPGPRAH